MTRAFFWGVGIHQRRQWRQPSTNKSTSTTRSRQQHKHQRLQGSDWTTGGTTTASHWREAEQQRVGQSELLAGSEVKGRRGHAGGWRDHSEEVEKGGEAGTCRRC